MEELMQRLAKRVERLEKEVKKLKAEKENSPCTPIKGKDESVQSHDTREKFRIPSPREVQEYINYLHEVRFTANEFVNYYDSVGWMVGKNKPMKNWKSAVRLWINKRNKEIQYGQANRYESRAEREQRIREEHDREFLEHIRRKLASSN